MQLFKKLKQVFFSGAYDSAKTTTRRGSAKRSVRSEDRELTNGERSQLIANSRDSSRNMALAGWVIRKHLSFVARYRVQFRTGDEDLDKRLTDLWTWWSRKENCDIARRHSFDSIIELMERHAIVDGDVALYKLGNGRVQLIEGDRIADPKSAAAVEVDQEKLVHGVEVDDAGRAIRYMVNRRTKRGNLEFERAIRARDLEFYGYFERADQVRGISRLAPVLAYLRDLRELFEYQLAANKFTSLFGLKFTRAAEPDDPGGFEEEDVSEAQDGSEFEFDVRGGPMKIELNAGEDCEAIESKNPSREFQDFSTAIIQLTLLALDVPMTFFDSRRSSFSAGRQDMAMYMETVINKRRRLHEVINAIIAWQIGRWASSNQRGEGAPLLELPDGVLPREIKWDIISTGVVWVDQLKEVSADALAVSNAFKSRQQVCMQQGRDFFNVAKQLAAEENLITELGITVTIGQPGQTTTRDEEGATNPANVEAEIVEDDEDDDDNSPEVLSVA